MGKRTFAVAFKNLKRLGGDERGVVLFYTAIITFFVLALFSLVHDVTILSDEKVQMQNAADAAAMEMAVWQARGMNIVQNINDEIYDIDYGIIAAYITAAALSYAALALYAIPFVGPALATAAKLVAAAIAYISRLLRLTTVEICLIPLRFLYANGSVAMGYVGANSAAQANSADRFFDALPVYAAGIPTKLDETAYRLPLEYKEAEDPHSLPLNTSSSSLGDGLWAILAGGFGVNQFIQPVNKNFWLWNDYYYESKEDYEDGPLPRWIWAVQSRRPQGLISRYFLNTGADWMPVIAVAAGQAKGGNVIMKNSSLSKVRPRGWGTAADAVLVPVAHEDDFTSMLSRILLH